MLKATLLAVFLMGALVLAQDDDMESTPGGDAMSTTGGDGEDVVSSTDDSGEGDVSSTELESTEDGSGSRSDSDSSDLSTTDSSDSGSAESDSESGSGSASDSGSDSGSGSSSEMSTTDDSGSDDSESGESGSDDESSHSSDGDTEESEEDDNDSEEPEESVDDNDTEDDTETDDQDPATTEEAENTAVDVADEDDVCVGLDSAACGSTYDAEGMQLCGYNTETDDCYEVVMSAGIRGKGNFDDGYEYARAQADERAKGLYTAIGVLGGILAILVLTVIGGAYHVRSGRKHNEYRRTPIPHDVIDVDGGSTRTKAQHSRIASDSRHHDQEPMLDTI